jgi:hypothetical protein
MPVYHSPAILGQVVPDNTTDVIIKIINQAQIPTLRIVPMPGAKGDSGSFATLNLGDGLNYNSGTNTLSITKIDGGTV